MISDNLKQILNEIPPQVKLIAVSKTKSVEAILEAYNAGQKCFGENKVQELVKKYEKMPKDIEWHLIGHLQTNKVKYVAPFVAMVHSVDSIKLLETIDKEAQKNNRIIKCLLQVYIATEETKFGLDENELKQLIIHFNTNKFKNVDIVGLMGMASFTENDRQVSKEFSYLASLFNKTKNEYFVGKTSFNVLSMGMSGDYKIAISEGSNMVRIGSLIFGERTFGQSS
jgi:PLP dependent protein